MTAAERSPAFGIALLIGGGAILAFVDASIKLLPPSTPVGQLMFIRGMVTMACIAVLGLSRGWVVIRPRNLRGQAMRAGCFVAGTFLFTEALWRIPFAEANAI